MKNQSDTFPKHVSYKITAEEIKINSSYINEKGGVLNALTTASAQYIYKVCEKNSRRNGNIIKRFDNAKVKMLRRNFIHTNAHLDEYYAELIFRVILPPHLKDLEIREHSLIAKDNDTLAKSSWPSGVVFGIRPDETGGAEALQVFDEHNADGTRIKPSCSQLVAEEYLGNSIPPSVQAILDEVNMSDSNKGAHQYNLKNIIPDMHNLLLVVGFNHNKKEPINKYMTEQWKRAIINACIAAMIYCYENNIYNHSELQNDKKIELERMTKKSLDYFNEKNILKDISPIYEEVRGIIYHHFRVNYKTDEHPTIDKAVWRDNHGNYKCKQLLIIHRICYALEKCWGIKIANLIMMHIWQILFQKQLSFKEISNQITFAKDEGGILSTSFGEIEKRIIKGVKYRPEQSEKDLRKRDISDDYELWIIYIKVTNPCHYNCATVIKNIVNGSYTSRGNEGFGVFLLHDQIINSKVINRGSTFPYDKWEKLSDEIQKEEPECWFQLKSIEDEYADFLINRNKAHQEQLPSDLDIDKLEKIILSV